MRLLTPTIVSIAAFQTMEVGPVNALIVMESSGCENSAVSKI